MSAAKREDPEREPLTERELERVSELVLHKLLRRLAKVAVAPPPAERKPDADKPTAADFEAYNAYLKRRGRANE